MLESLSAQPLARARTAVIAVVVAVCALPSVLCLFGFDFGSSGTGLGAEAGVQTEAGTTEAMFGALSGSFTHTILEWTAASLALFTVILAFVHFRIKRDAVTPIIGVALFWAGCTDAFHTLAADRLILATADNQDLIPFTWAISRTFNAIIPLTALAMVFFVRRFDKETAARRSFAIVLVVSLLLGVAAYAVIQYCATSTQLPKTMFPDALFTRPWDVFPLGIYLVSGLVIYPLFARGTKSLFAFALWLSVIPDAATQFHMAFGSTALFDNHFNIAHFIKIIAYLIPCLGLVLDYVRGYEEEERAKRHLQVAQRKLQEQTRRLEASNRELQNFATVAAHDLQEPLRKIQAFSSRIQQKYVQHLPPAGHDYFDRVTGAAERMSALIADLLSFAQIQSRAKPYQPIDLNVVVQEVLCDLEARIEESGGVVNVANLPMVEADPSQMRQLFQNLLGNALKFRRTGVQPVIDVVATHVDEFRALQDSAVFGEQDSPCCEIHVSDNGIGFSPDHLKKIFALFQRLHNRAQYEGTGIGLAVCRKIAERHSGAITAHSAPGEGATFVVRLPLRQKEAA
ncbi:MAG: hypothetical protein JKY37_31320 [Nannocystaceae bacterium]|nr:hypothetical protein [Nannocystaceae bacterium]